MTVTLALDTSTRIGAIGLGEAGDVLVESALEVRATHSEAVLPEIRRLMEVAGRGLDDLEAVVVGSGPGSFTGVRIAAAFAKGICHARSIPLYAYSTLAAIAVPAAGARPVCATIDARRGQVYAAGYSLGPEYECRFGPVAISADHLPGLLDESEPWLLAGGGLESLPGRIAG